MKIIDIKPENLEKILNVFESVGIECFQIFFPGKNVIQKPWQVVKQLKGKFDYILTMSSANEIYKTVLTIGASETSLQHLFEKGELQNEEIIDVLGEFANTYYAMLSDEKFFSDQFGILIQSLPVLYTKGQSLLTFLWWVEGKIYFENGEDSLYFGYAIQKQ